MICVLLCAGYATRMYPLTENFPKPLLDIKGKTIIDYLIDDLETKKHIDKYVVVSNHKFINHFTNWEKTRKENIVLLDDGSTDNCNRLGAVKDILYAIDKESIKDDILVLAGDNLLDFSLNDFIAFSKSNNSNAIMTYAENDIKRLQRTGVIEIDNSNKVLSFEEKPHNPKSNHAVPPFYIFKKEDLHLISKGIEEGCKVDAPGMFIEWFAKHATIYAWNMTGKRVDIGNLEDYYKIIKSLKVGKK